MTENKQYEEKLINALMALEELLKEKPTEVSIDIVIEYVGGASRIFNITSIPTLTVQFKNLKHYDITQRVLESPKSTT